MKKLLLLLLLLPSIARAQATAQTIVTGTIVDPAQVPYYPTTVTACLFPVTVDPTVDGVHVNPNQGANYCIGPAQTSPTGFFTMALFPNANIFNAGNNNGTTQWQFTVVSAGSAPPAGKGPQTFYLTITIAGTSQNISTQLNANAPLQLNSGGGGGNGNVIGTGTANNVSCWMNANAIYNCPDITDPSGAPIIAAPLKIVSGTGPTGISMQEGAPANCLTPAAGLQILCSINSPDSLVLSSNGGAYAAISSGGGGGGTPGGSSTDVQINVAGSFAGNPNFTFDPSTLSLVVNGGASTIDLIQAGPTNSNGLTVTNQGTSITSAETGAITQISAEGGIVLQSNTNGVNLGILAEPTPLNFVGSSNSALFTVSTNSTASLLNLGANASLTSAGALTVTSCTGCGGGSPPGTAGQLIYNQSGVYGANTWTTNGSTSISAPTNGTLNLSAGSATAGFFLPTAAGAAPTGAGRLSYNSTSNCPVFGNGTTTISLCGGGTPTFGSIASGTNTTAAMVLGTGSSLTFTGGTNNASSINGVTVTGVPLSGYVPTATSGSAATWQAPSGGGGISGLTTGFLPKAASTTTVANSLCDEGITTANVFTCTDTGGMALPDGNISIGPLTNKHAVISAADGSYISYQSDGVTPSIPSIIGTIGSTSGAGTGKEGISWNADNLPHGYIGGFDMGAPPIVLLSVSGTNTYVSSSPVGALQKGQMYCFDPVVSSTNTTPTMNVNSLGAITITKSAGSALVSGDLIAAHMSCMEYNGTTFDLLNPAVSSGSSITGLTTNGNVYAASSTTIASVTPPTVNGQYNCGYTVTASTSVTPTCPLIGLAGRAITGAATTDTVLYNDNATVVNHDQAASGAINETLPTVTTLGNGNFVYSYANHSAQTDTITPTTWTIQQGSNVAASTLSVPPGAFVRIKVDPNSSTNWLADLTPTSGKVANGNSTLGTSAISSGTCATVVTTSATGVLTSDAIQWNPNTDPTAVTGYGPSASGSLYIWAYPTANNINFKVCNNTSASITPSALTLNWKVSR